MNITADMIDEATAQRAVTAFCNDDKGSRCSSIIAAYLNALIEKGEAKMAVGDICHEDRDEPEPGWHMTASTFNIEKRMADSHKTGDFPCLIIRLGGAK